MCKLALALIIVRNAFIKINMHLTLLALFTTIAMELTHEPLECRYVTVQL